MARIVIYDESSGSVLKYLKSANTPEYEGRPDVLINPEALLDVPLIDINSNNPIIPTKYWIVDLPAKVLREMSQAEKDAVDLEEAANQAAQQARVDAFRGQEILAELNAELVRNNISDSMKQDLVSAIHDILLLLMTGQLQQAKSVAAALTPSGNLNQALINRLNTFLSREIP